MLAVASEVTVVSSTTLGPITESTDVELKSCRVVAQPEPIEPQNGVFPVVVAPAVTRFVALSTSTAPSVTFEVNATGADRCRVGAEEVLRTTPGQSLFTVEVAATALVLNSENILRANCSVGGEPSAQSASSVNVYRGDVNETMVGSFSNVSTDPTVILGSLFVDSAAPATYAFPSVSLLSGSLRIESNSSTSPCGPSSTTTVSAGNLTAIGQQLLIQNNYRNGSAFCPGGLTISMASLRDAGSVFVSRSAFVDQFRLQALASTDSVLVELFSASAVSFNALARVEGAFTIRKSDDLDTFISPVLADVSGDLKFSEIPALGSIQLNGLTHVGGSVTMSGDLGAADVLTEFRLPSLAEVGGSFVVEDEDVIRVLTLNNLGSVGADSASTASFTLDNNAFNAAGGFTVTMPATPAVVSDNIVITNNRKMTQEDALAIASKLTNPGFAAATVTNNRP